MRSSGPAAFGGPPVTNTEIAVTATGFALPVIAAPFVTIALRRLFALFVAEGAELFSNMKLSREDSYAVGALIAKFDVAALLFTWLGFFALHVFEQPILLRTSVAIAGILTALALTILIVRTNLQVRGRTLAIIGMMAFAGGNLPLIVVMGAVMGLLG